MQFKASRNETAPVSPETSWCENSAGGWSLVASVVGRLHFDWRDISEVLVEPAAVEPVDPFGGSQLDFLDGPPGLAGLDQSVLYRPLIVSASALS
jgi:hypothetical protein